MFLEKEKIIFVHIPKCAGTSIEVFLCEKFGYLNVVTTFANGEKGILNDANQEIIHGYLLKYNGITGQHFTLKDIIDFKKIKLESLSGYTVFAVVRNPYHRILSDLIFYNLLKNNNVDDLYNIVIDYLKSTKKFDNHKLEQHKFLSLDGDSLYNNVIVVKMENLSEEIKKIDFMKDFNNRYNKQKIKIDYDTLLTAQVKEIIYNHYKKDFEIFGYEK
jgi:hypothetical protein